LFHIGENYYAPIHVDEQLDTFPVRSRALKGSLGKLFYLAKRTHKTETSADSAPVEECVAKGCWPVISFTQLPQKLSAISSKKWIWIGVGFAAGLATHIYYVQEMVAALTIFSVLFVGVSIAALATFLLVRANKPIMAWATPKALWVAHWGVDMVQGVIANQAWARSVPRGFRRGELKLNEKYRMAYLRFIGLKPNQVYRVGLRAGGTALTVGLSTQKRMANRLGNWLTQKVSYSDLIHLASTSQVRAYTRRHRRASGG
jgi:hypothetical protein